MNTKVLAVLLVALQCGVLLTQAARPLGEEASHGSLRKVLDFASSSTGTFASSNDANGFAGAALDVFADDGDISGTATANSHAFSIAKNAIAEATSIAITEVKGKGYAKAIADAAAEATGKAIAKAKVDTLVEIISTGKNNHGCGTAKAFAEAEAEAFALAIAKVFAKAGNKKAESIVKGKVIAIKKAYVNAVAESFSNACVNGKGYVKAKQSAFAVAAAKVYAGVYAKALAVVKGPLAGGAVIGGGGVDSDEFAVAGGKDESYVSGEGFSAGGTYSFADVDSDYPWP